jgi:hypothetical protein
MDVVIFHTEPGNFSTLYLPLLTGPRPLILDAFNQVDALNRVDFLNLIQAAPAFHSDSPNLVFATPNGLAGFPVLRTLVPPDIPDLSAIYQPLLSHPVIGPASPTAGMIPKWGPSGDALIDGYTPGQAAGDSWIIPASPGNNMLWGWDNTDALVKPVTIGTNLVYDHASHTLSAAASSMVYPGAGIPISTGSAWNTSVPNDTSNVRKFLRELSVDGVFQTPAWDTIEQADVSGLTTGSSPTFAGATIGSLSGLIKGTAGALSGLTAAQALTEIGIGQAWTTPDYSAGNFTASGAMTWTVEAGDVITYAYNIIGKTMTVAFGIDGAAIGGTPSNILFIAIPGGKTASKITMNPVLIFNGSWSTGYCEVYPGSYDGKILVLLTGAPNFSAGQVKIYGQITFEIN